MTNFTIFNQADLNALITPYANGMAPYVTPIKYEALTPDIFALLFRTIERDKSDHYFVSLQYDYIDNLESAKKIIEDWHGEVIGFLYPEIANDEDSPRIKVDEVYYALLAKVAPPTGRGYWADNIIIRTQTEAESVIADLPEKYRENVHRAVMNIYEKHPDVAISIYLHEDGTTEYFFE